MAVSSSSIWQQMFGTSAYPSTGAVRPPTTTNIPGLGGNAVQSADWNNESKNYAELSNNTVTFISNGKVLFSIMPDGRIAKGEAFTTTDEMSIEFWNKVAENFSVAWWKSLIKSRGTNP